MAEVCGKTGWRVHAYVMMGNHYHLLIETPEPNLGAWWLRQRTTAGRQWVCERLWRGEVSAQSVKGGRDAKVERMKKKLTELSDEA